MDKHLMSVEQIEQEIKSLNPSVQSGTKIVFEFGNGSLLTFATSDKILEDVSLREQIIVEIKEAIILSDAMDTDPLLNGKVEVTENGQPKQLSVFSSLSRNLPNLSFYIHVFHQGEILASTMQRKRYPTAILHDYDRLAQVLRYCFQFGRPVNLTKRVKAVTEKAKPLNIEQVRAKLVTANKANNAPEIEKLSKKLAKMEQSLELVKERAQTVKQIKTARNRELENQRAQYRPQPR
jgi:hypothetical protein